MSLNLERTRLPADHPDRLILADEVHARPSEPLETPQRISHFAVVIGPDQRGVEHAHMSELCGRFEVAPPDLDGNHFTADLGPVRVRWERHGEFSSYTVFAAGLGATPYSEMPAAMLPQSWLSAIPGTTIFAGHARLARLGDETPGPALLAAYFEENTAIGAGVGGDAGMAFADFRVHADGFSRFLILDRGFTPLQAGRMVQRLFEIETYRMMALLALPIARAQSSAISGVERALSGLTDNIAHKNLGDEPLLHQLTELAATVESMASASQFRYGACRAYHELVTRRIAELRESRIDGHQTMEEFMVRRFTPAVATCASTAQRLHDLSERVAQTSALLSTRVDIARERQNHLLLSSMDDRAKAQLRLQQTVEIISVVPITYYLAAIFGHVFAALHAGGLPIEPEIAQGLAIPVIFVVVATVMWRIHHRLTRPRDGTGGG